MRKRNKDNGQRTMIDVRTESERVLEMITEFRDFLNGYIDLNEPKEQSPILTIGKVISDKRKSKGMQRSKLAQLADVSYHCIYTIERDQRGHRLITMKAICRVLGLDYRKDILPLSIRNPGSKVVTPHYKDKQTRAKRTLPSDYQT